MAKSKSGGTRSMIRGRVGADVYSVGRDAKGKKQQIVRSLAETVSNPQTQAQMRGRMIMATVAQALAALRPIVDHSFDDVVGSRANLAEFTSRNYALIKADVAAHASGNNYFGLNKWQEKGAKQGAYLISDGQAQLPAALVLTKATGVISITLNADNVTVAGLKSKLGLASDEYFTLVGLTSDGTPHYERFRIDPNLDESTAITIQNAGSIFLVEGNVSATVGLESNVISITDAAIAGCCAIIISKKSSGKYIHNEAKLGAAQGNPWTADVALPTYPVGAQNYLNGGDIFGMTESDGQESAAPEPTPTPENTHTLTISKTGTGSYTLKNGSTNVNSGASVADGTELSLEISPADGQVPTATLNGSSVSLTQSSSKYIATITMPSQNSTLVVNTGEDDDYDPNA